MFNYLVNTFQGGLASSHMNYIFENESHEVSHTSSIVLIFDSHKLGCFCVVKKKSKDCCLLSVQ